MQTYTPRPREYARECIEAYILTHDLRAGDSLPPERDMCAMWGLNRSTLRSAIAQLTVAGRLVSVQGSGTRIAPRFRRTLQDLQSFSDYAASSGFTAETRLLSFSTVECDKHLARRFRRVLGEKLYRISRLRILNDTPVLIETTYIPVELAPHLEEHDLVNGSLFAVLEEVYGLRLDHGEEKASITLANAEEAAHLHIRPGDAVFWIVSRTDAPDGTTVEYCRTVARGDVVEMAGVLRWRSGEEDEP